MTPAHAAAARNTKNAVEGKIIVTDEELQQTIQSLTESIEKLSDPDKPLTREEERRRQVFILEKETLQQIKSTAL